MPVKVIFSVIPATVASTVFAPTTVVPRVRVVSAWPFVPVVAVVVLRLPPPAVTANVTDTFDMAVPAWSRTSTTNASANATPGSAVWLSPEIFTSVVATWLTVAVNVTFSAIPSTVASTVWAPTLVAPNVSVVSARPVASVETVVALIVPPPAITANVTGTPANTCAGFAPSFTSTTNEFAKVALSSPVCESPDTFVSVVGVREVYVTLALFRLAMARSIAGMCVLSDA